MADLVAQLPLAGFDETRGTVRAVAFDPAPVWSIAAFPGAEGALPGPGGIAAMGKGRLVWSGRNLALLLGDAPQSGLDAAVTDQSDAYAWVRVSGAGVCDVIARFCPLDTRPAAFPVGTSARSLCGHMSALYIRIDAETFEIACYRSMAETLRHEVLEAMERVAARA